MVIARVEFVDCDVMDREIIVRKYVTMDDLLAERDEFVEAFPGNSFKILELIY